jgi:glycosyltransferase involved in cell wall biosynthesis
MDEGRMFATRTQAPARTGESRYAVVIPAYEESATIADVAARAAAQVDLVIVVDDGSSDGTSKKLAGLPVVVLRNERNSGKGASLWRGMRYALEQGAVGVVTLDADGQHQPEDIPRLLHLARQHPEDIIIGARCAREAAAPRARYFANRTADFWISYAARQSLPDSQSGFRVYPAAVLGRVHVKHGPTRGFVFESEFLIEAARRGTRIRSVPIAAVYPPQARRSHFRPVLDIARIVRMVAGKLLRRPVPNRSGAPQRLSSS